jgi:hypothetical protein
MTAIEKPAHWLDILRKAPPTPLARGVPAVSISGACHVVMASQRDAARGTAAGKWRIDLDDPQGFGYALRWLRQHDGGDWWTFAVNSLVPRHLADQTTDADRVDLAKALAEVTS